MAIYQFEDYKQCLKAVLQDKKENVSSYFTYQKMAEACGVQKTYLSRVLRTDGAHLSEEQLYLAAKFVGLGKEERNFLSLLRLRDRSVDKELQLELEEEIYEIRKKKLTTEEYISAVVPDQISGLHKYYLDPRMSVLHMFLTIPRYASQPKLIKESLSLSEEELTAMLTYLESQGIIHLTGAGYEVLKYNTHLSVSSPFYKSHRNQQRLWGLNKLSVLNSEKAYSFSVTFSSNPQTRMTIQKKILELVSSIEEEVKDSPEEEVYQLNMDLFDWS